MIRRRSTSPGRPPLLSSPSRLRMMEAERRAYQRGRSFVGYIARSRVRMLLAAISCLVGVSLIENLLEGVFVTRFDMEDDEAKSTSITTTTKSNSTGKPPSHSDLSPPAPTTATNLQHVMESPPHSIQQQTNATKNDTVPPPDNHIVQPPFVMSNQSAGFVSRWCDLTRVEWYPSVGQQQQQQQQSASSSASPPQWYPYFLIPGAKFSGTSILSQMLQQHPNIKASQPAESSFFLDGAFRRRFVTRDEKTLVYAARQRMYAAHYNHIYQKKNNNNKNNNRNNPNNKKQQQQQQQQAKSKVVVSFDATPGYLFYSTLLPRRILCVIPWVKLVILLRDPVDRLYYQYQTSTRKWGLKLDFETWLEHDFQRLISVGLVIPTNSSSTSSSDQTNSSKPTSLRPLDRSTLAGRNQEDMAWFKYHNLPGEGGPVGRSLYDIQLRQWLQALRAAGKDPAKDVIIVWTEQLAANPNRELQRIVNFLKLPILPAASVNSWANSTNQTTLQVRASRLQPAAADAISSATRRRLEKFFRPYNRRLEILLNQYRIPLGKERSYTERKQEN